MNKNFIILVVIILTASVTFVSTQGSDTLKSELDYSDADSLVIHKLWIGDDSAVRPDSVTVRIFADGTLLETVSITQNNGWVYDSGRLLFPVNNTDGSKVKYTFEEVGVDNYSLKFSENDDLNYTLTNTYTKLTQDNSTDNNSASANNSSTSHTNKTSKNPVKQNSDKKNSVSTIHKGNPPKKVSVKHSDKHNSTGNKMLKTGNNIWAIVVCIFVIAAAVIYSRR